MDLALFVLTSGAAYSYFFRQRNNSKPVLSTTPATTATMSPAVPGSLIEPALQGDLIKIQSIIEKLRQHYMVSSSSRSSSSESSSELSTHISDYVNYQDPMGGNAAIHCAVFSGHLPIVQYLIESCNASITSQNNIGCTPFWVAAGYNHISIVNYLLSLNDTISQNDMIQPNCTGDTPLLAAASKGYFDMCYAIIQSYSSKMQNDNDMVLLLGSKNQKGDTPLLQAIAHVPNDIIIVGAIDEDHSTTTTNDDKSNDDNNNTLRSVLSLLCHPTIINHTNANGITPLLLAEKRSLPNIVQLLQDYINQISSSTSSE